MILLFNVQDELSSIAHGAHDTLYLLTKKCIYRVSGLQHIVNFSTSRWYMFPARIVPRKNDSNSERTRFFPLKFKFHGVSNVK